MRTSPILLAVLTAAACKGDGKKAGAHGEGAVAPPGPVVDAPVSKRAALAACTRGLTAPRTGLDGGLGALLAGCTPCGVSWQPLITMSGFDPEGLPPTDLPAPDQVLAILDACEATCKSSARSEVVEILRDTQIGRSPSKPWRAIAERCHAALALDERTRRFARGTWYALAQVARAVWRDDVPAEVAAARDAAPLDFPLPPFSEASTAFALPRADALDPTPPRLHVTITQDQIQIGALPFVRVAAGALSLVPTPGADYPGTVTPIDELGRGIAELVTAATDLGFDLGNSPVMLAPREMPARRLLEVLGKMPGARIFLAASPRVSAGPWPEPVGAIPVFLSTTAPFPDLPLLDASDPVALAGQIAALPSTASAVRISFAAEAKVRDVADAVSALAAHGVDRAALEQAAAVKAPPP